MKVFVTGATGYVGIGGGLGAREGGARGHRALPRAGEGRGARGPGRPPAPRRAREAGRALEASSARSMRSSTPRWTTASGLPPIARPSTRSSLRRARPGGRSRWCTPRGSGCSARPPSRRTRTAPTRPSAAVAWRPSHEQLVVSAGTRSGGGDPAGHRVRREARARHALVRGRREGGTAERRRERPPALGPRAPGRLAELYRLVVEQRARGVFNGVDGASPTVEEAASAAASAAGKDGSVRAIPVEEARKTMGAVADALAMSQVIASTRAPELGWRPRHLPFVQEAPAVYREWRS